ncbi:DNA excision repair protein ERCC-1-like [Dendronephthya gigantea]|uniref:DNA excision repair protein ERCC-1-like n=1 Tax=Dendronephthya gigantea TaxID=151771 RepID=UPI00106AA4D9|nr:DNA excision repair protein ERCC-1-like [Dendronephthya gigantea]
MADKTTKRKAFDIPILDDLDEVVQITPVFTRRTKTRRPEECKTSVSEPETSKTTQRLTAKSDGENALIPAPRRREIETEKAPVTRVETTQSETDVTEASVSEESGKTVGRNFLETFAFIEDTKYYEAPPSKPSTSKFSERAGSMQEQEAKKPANSSKSNAVIVNQRQKGNPVLKFFRNVPWEYGDVIPDYVMGQRICALFLSIRYHNFNPEYIHERLKQLGKRYDVRILLVQVDIKDPHKTLKELTKIAILADCTLILAWSAEEAARYIEIYKIYENKPPDALQGQTNTDYLSKLTDCLTTVKSVNKTDTVTLLSAFESLENIISASQDDIALCPGFGPQKAKRLHEAFHQPFLINKKKVEKTCDKKAKS